MVQTQVFAQLLAVQTLYLHTCEFGRYNHLKIDIPIYLYSELTVVKMSHFSEPLLLHQISLFESALVRPVFLLYLRRALQVFECFAYQWFGQLYLLPVFN